MSTNIKKQKLTEKRHWIPMLSLFISVVLLIIKFYAYHVTGSQSIFSDALESIVNVVAGAITIIVIILAAKPADNDHPYGHGKLESIAATFEGGAITLAGILIVIQAIQVFFHGATLNNLDTGLFLTIIAGIINGILGFILNWRGKEIHSDALQSSGTHLMGDALTSIGVLLSLVLVKYTQAQWIDPVIAGIFGLILGYSGIKILIRSGNVLLDGHDRELLTRLANIFDKNYRPGIIHIHHTRIIRSGHYHHIDCHIVIPEFWSIAESHAFGEAYEHAVIKDYPVEGELRIHLDPCRRVYCESCEINPCPIRGKNFIGRKPIVYEELTSPEESL